MSDVTGPDTPDVITQQMLYRDEHRRWFVMEITYSMVRTWDPQEEKYVDIPDETSTDLVRELSPEDSAQLETDREAWFQQRREEASEKNKRWSTAKRISLAIAGAGIAVNVIAFDYAQISRALGR